MYRRPAHSLWKIATRTASTTKHKPLTDTNARIHPPIQNQNKQRKKMEQLKATFFEKIEDRKGQSGIQSSRSFKKSSPL